MSMNIRNTLLVALCLTAASTLSARAVDQQLKAEADQAMQNFKQKDPSLDTFFKNSVGYAVFPNVGEGGLIIGGARGRGLVYQNGKPVGEATVTKATIGAQAGGQSFAEVIFFQTPETLRDFKASNLELSAGVGAVVAAEGAAETASYQNGVAIFTLPKSGVMGKAAIGGQKFKFQPYE